MKLVKFLTTVNEADPPFAAGLPGVVRLPWQISDQRSYADLKVYMLDKGYKPIGTGGYSRIYEPPGGENYVIKILKTSVLTPSPEERAKGGQVDWGLTAKGEQFDYYRDFLCSVKWLRLSAKETNPHFPVVYKVGTFEFPVVHKYGERAAAFYAVMERLEPYNYRKLEFPYEAGTDDWARYAAAILLYELDSWDTRDEQIKRILELPEVKKQDMRGWGVEKMFLYVCRKNTNLPICNAMVKIFNFIDEVQCKKDFKWANAMLRNGTPVFIDPIEG